jgi:hypothetical protein
MIHAAPSAMAEVLVEYDTVVAGADGSRWAARACGRMGEGNSANMWEGWVEFVPVDPGRRPVRSGRESTQPSRPALLYWATGLSPLYLRGALTRALQPPLERPDRRRPSAHFEGPAPGVVHVASSPLFPHPILDPFDVYAQGEEILIRQLDALDMPRLRDIALAYELMTAPQAESATRVDLAAAIVNAARANATRV